MAALFVGIEFDNLSMYLCDNAVQGRTAASHETYLIEHIIRQRTQVNKYFYCITIKIILV